MQMDTKYFGEIEYDETDVLHFPEGLFGFEEEKAFLLLPFDGDGSLMLCLQSVQTPQLAFIVMNPFKLKPDYAPELRAEELRVMQVERSQALCFYVLCALKKPASESTVNLRCPVAINDATRQAVQVILETDAYHMRHPLSAFTRDGEAAASC